MLVYDNPQNKRDVLFDFLRWGSDEDLVYVCSEEEPAQIREEMMSFGIQVDSLEERGMLTVRNYDDVYIVNEQCRAVSIVGEVSAMARRSLKKGFRGLRGAGEMSCFFRQGKVDELLQYERALHTTFDFPLKGICAYDVVQMGNSGYLETLLPIARSHGPVILTGPNGRAVLESKKLKEKDLETTMQIRV